MVDGQLTRKEVPDSSEMLAFNWHITVVISVVAGPSYTNWGGIGLVSVFV
jgi:hypothetical protein